MSDKVRAALAAIVEGKTLTTEEARGAMGSVMDGERYFFGLRISAKNVPV